MKVTTRKGKAYLKPEGELKVARALEFKDALLSSIEKADIIEINLVNVTEIDLACLQLLCSAHRTAMHQGKNLAVKDSSLPFYLEARTNAGFIFDKPCSYSSTEDCLWIGGNEQWQK